MTFNDLAITTLCTTRITLVYLISDPLTKTIDPVTRTAHEWRDICDTRHELATERIDKLVCDNERIIAYVER